MVQPVCVHVYILVPIKKEIVGHESSERAFKIPRIPDIDDIVNSSSEPMVSVFIPEI